MEQKNYQRQSDVIRRVYYSLKNNWLLIAIIVAVAIVAGIVISYFQVPVYTATCKTIYKAEADLKDGEKYDNITLTNRYLSTVVEFCRQGCIVDRANYYYRDFKKGNYKTVQEYIETKISKIEDGKDPYQGYDGPEYILMSNVKISHPLEDGYVINISYTDKNATDAKNKVLLLFAAINREARVMVERFDEMRYKYFYNAKITLTNTTLNPTPYNSVNRKKTVLISAVIGVVISFATVYVQNMFNRTIRNREELESCTGTSLLAYIEDQGE